ncbi:MAG: hypothetical protein JNJ46_05595 [Myxococcales bacterium]|nr:hypothetical protein [Myxococcales bacterium]
MRFFFADTFPDLPLSWHGLPPPWVLPCTLPRAHQDRLCVLFLSALRGLSLLALLSGGEWRERLRRAEALAEAAQDLYGQWLGRLLRAVAERDAAQLQGVRDFFQGRGMPYEARIAAQLLASDAPTRWDDALRTLPFF